MSQTLESVKKRINSIEATKKITSTMQLVSSVKVRKLINVFNEKKNILETQKIILNNAVFLSKSDVIKSFNSKLLKENKKENKKLYIVIMSNLGLCGGYNQLLYKYFQSIYKEGDEVILIGRKAVSLFNNDNNIKAYTDFVNVANNLENSDFDSLIDFIIKKYVSDKYNSIHVVYQRYVNSLISLPIAKKLLPLEINYKNNLNSYEPEYIPSREVFIEKFIPFYLGNYLKTIFYEASLSEQTIRRNMMDNADKSAKDLIESLKLEYNKERQTLITNEITEVVNSANAIKKS